MRIHLVIFCDNFGGLIPWKQNLLRDLTGVEENKKKGIIIEGKMWNSNPTFLRGLSTYVVFPENPDFIRNASVINSVEDGVSVAELDNISDLYVVGGESMFTYFMLEPTDTICDIWVYLTRNLECAPSEFFPIHLLKFLILLEKTEVFEFGFPYTISKFRHRK